MNIIPQNQFDPAKLNLKIVPHVINSHNSQYILFFNYDFLNGSDNALILTDPIKVQMKGLETTNQFYPTDNHCLKFFLNLDGEDGKKLKSDFIDKLDSKFEYLNGQQKLEVGDGKYAQKCQYQKCNKTVNLNQYDDSDEDENKNNYHIQNRIKLELDTHYNPTAHIDEPKLIKTTVFLPVNKHAKIEDREFKSESEIITCLDDLRNLYHVGCTVRFVIKISKLWIQKSIDPDIYKRRCGISLKVMQMYILDDPHWNQFDQNKPIIFEGLKIAKKTLVEKIEDTNDTEIMDDDYVGEHIKIKLNPQLENSESDSEVDYKSVKPEKSVFELDSDSE